MSRCMHGIHSACQSQPKEGCTWPNRYLAVKTVKYVTVLSCWWPKLCSKYKMVFFTGSKHCAPQPRRCDHRHILPLAAFLFIFLQLESLLLFWIASWWTVTDVWLLVKLFFKELGLRSTYISHNNLSCQEEGHPAMIGNPVIWFFLWNLVISMKHCQPCFSPSHIPLGWDPALLSD